MSRKRALIVDDSKTAQIRLKRMLERFELDVDVAFSAEEALGYLSYQMPAVIFMDHHMEGMDGLDALRIIKANPNTATVPVIMYTSESGDVYVGQARALGALDILSKEVIKSSGLEQTLAKLNISPQGEGMTGEQSAQDVEEITAHSNEKTPTPETAFSHETPHALSMEDDDPVIAVRSNIQEVKTQIARLFQIHIADVRSQISDQSKYVVRRLSGEIASLNSSEDLEEEIAESALHEEQDKKIKRDILATDLLLLIVITGLIALAIMLYQSQRKISNLTEIVAENTSQVSSSAFATDTNASPYDNASGTKMNTLALMDTIGWAMNNSLFIPQNDVVFGQEQLLNIQNLIYQLDSAGYKGIVELNVHLGDFCLEQTPEGTTVLADPSLPLSECYYSRIANSDLSEDDVVNVPYIQFEQTAAPIVNGDISLVLNFVGFENPLVAYPRVNELTTASSWNSVAALNNKIVVRLGISSDLL